MNFYACLYGCGMYTIDRITKGFGGIVTTFETLEELENMLLKTDIKSIITAAEDARRNHCRRRFLPKRDFTLRRIYK